MTETAKTRFVLAGMATVVILLGIASRMFPLGNLLTDKYLGDALYAILLYLVLRVLWPTRWLFCLAMATLGIVAIECFQLTGIPLNMRRSDSQYLKLLSVLLGTKFGWLDMVAYAIGLMLAAACDWCWCVRRPMGRNE